MHIIFYKYLTRGQTRGKLTLAYYDVKAAILNKKDNGKFITNQLKTTWYCFQVKGVTC